jgi:alpha-amylase/alpha-mannosidase (GH57 family)
MWLPETAVDEETLGILIDSDIKFTILAPWQAKDKSIETSRPYRVNIHNGKSIVVFFYQMDISTRLSFDPGATSNADRFLIEFLLPAYKNNSKQELLIAASDGELYGHHQQFRDKFLNRLLDRSGTNAVINNTYPARYLRDHPPRRSCKISSRTSWSCHHGVSRWSEDCGCTPGSTWKAPLRVGLNTIAEELDRVYFDQISSIELDPWLLRDDYIHVILGETPIDKWLAWFTDRKFDSDGIRWITWVMESQVARQKMFTSCGWFFDELNRIEPKNNIGYAAQATVLLEKASKENLSKSMASKLESVQSTRFDINGTDIFMEYYERGRKNLEKSVLFFP